MRGNPLFVLFSSTKLGWRRCRMARLGPDRLHRSSTPIPDSCFTESSGIATISSGAGGVVLFSGGFDAIETDAFKASLPSNRASPPTSDLPARTSLPRILAIVKAASSRPPSHLL